MNTQNRERLILPYLLWQGLTPLGVILGIAALAGLIMSIPALSGHELSVLAMLVFGSLIWAGDRAAQKHSAFYRTEFDRAVYRLARGAELESKTSRREILVDAKLRHKDRGRALLHLRKARQSAGRVLASPALQSKQAGSISGIMADLLCPILSGAGDPERAVHPLANLMAERFSALRPQLVMLSTAGYLSAAVLFLLGCLLGSWVHSMPLGVLWGYAAFLLGQRVLVLPALGAAAARYILKSAPMASQMEKSGQ